MAAAAAAATATASSAADVAVKGAAGAAAAADSPMADEALEELVSDCTCPICQGQYTNPQQLSCGHTFCLRCFNKLRRKWHSGGDGSIGRELLSHVFSMRLGSSPTSGNGANGEPLLCPVCRSSIDPHRPTKPDRIVGTLLQTLKAVKAGRCQQPDCWRLPEICCTSCACGLCAEHHREKLQAVRAGCQSLVEESEDFLRVKEAEANRLDKELAEAQHQLEELHKALKQSLQDQMEQCASQLKQAKQHAQQESQERAAISEALREEAARVRQMLQEEQPGPSLLDRRAELEQRLRSAKERYPPSELQLCCEPAKVASDCEAVLSGVSVRLLKRPYTERPGKIKPSLLKRTKHGEPWEVRLMSEDKLLVNYKGFPTRKLHVFNASSLLETGQVELQMTKGQFPGQTCVCNRRQRILASDPKKHCIYEFNFQGQMTGQFGSKGSEPDQLHAPKGLYVYEDLLYVVDSKNKRVQLFHMDRNYEHVGSVEHDKISTEIQAVFAGPASIVVCDRGNDTLLVFDRATRRFVKQLPAGGEPFDACTDQFDNVIISLTRERKVKVFDASVTQCINTFEVGAANGDDEATTEKLKNYLHGVAFDSRSGRLFVAQAFARRLLGFDL